MTALEALGAALDEVGVDREGHVLNGGLSLADDLGMDSFQLMQVARHLERAYDFQFAVADWALAEDAREDCGPTHTVGSLVAFIEGALARPAE